MIGSLRAQLLAIGAAALVAGSASAQEVVRAGQGQRVIAATLKQRAAEPAVSTPGPSSSAASNRDTVAVVVDHAKVVRLPERTQTVIIGNPIIADITVQRNGIVVVTGKSYGVTNMIALDGSGTMLAESLVSVQAATESVVVVQRGLDRESYSCTPNCQPSILLGDATKYFSEVGAQAGQRNSLATQR
jgi:Flp pilus assembly secretin CpaC